MTKPTIARYEERPGYAERTKEEPQQDAVNDTTADNGPVGEDGPQTDSE